MDEGISVAGNFLAAACKVDIGLDEVLEPFVVLVVVSLAVVPLAVEVVVIADGDSSKLSLSWLLLLFFFFLSAILESVLIDGLSC